MLLRLLSRLLRDDRGPARIETESLDALLRRGLALEAKGDFEAALQCYRACAAAYPSAVNPRLAMANALSTLWRTDEAIDVYAEALNLSPFRADIYSGYLLLNHYASAPDAGRIYELHREYGRHMSMQHARSNAFANSAEPERRLRIGYVSRNLSRHSVGYFVEPVLTHHDRGAFEVYCYYTHPQSDDATVRMRSLVDSWQVVPESESDADLASRIADDRIDVLIDLGGHTKLNRLGAFARKPAPLQITWLGYPNTTGLGDMDYRLSDGIADPEPSADALHTERLLRINGAFLCYRPPEDSPPVVPRRADDAIVFGSFNTLVKVNPALTETWARILDAVPASRLLIKCRSLEQPQTAARLLARFEMHGISRNRVALRSWTEGRVEHLASYGEVDIALDTFPYNGTTTTCEALWMGVPVVTRAGSMHMSRVGATLMSNAGLPELVTASADQYVDCAVRLARDRPRLAELREGMRERLLASPLLDQSTFVRNYERCVRAAWQDWCHGPRNAD